MARSWRPEFPILNARAIAIAVVQVASVAIVLGAVALVSWIVDQPILVPSLAACAFLQLLLPESAAARPWAVVAGQLTGLAAGILAVVALGAVHSPVFSAGHPLDARRAIAAVLAAGLTLAGQRALRADNAAGAALAVTVALGDASADLSSAIRSVIGILIVAALGELARRLVLALH